MTPTHCHESQQRRARGRGSTRRGRSLQCQCQTELTKGPQPDEQRRQSSRTLVRPTRTGLSDTCPLQMRFRARRQSAEAMLAKSWHRGQLARQAAFFGCRVWVADARVRALPWRVEAPPDPSTRRERSAGVCSKCLQPARAAEFTFRNKMNRLSFIATSWFWPQKSSCARVTARSPPRGSELGRRPRWRAHTLPPRSIQRIQARRRRAPVPRGSGPFLVASPGQIA